jgi:hypothetical protein
VGKLDAYYTQHSVNRGGSPPAQHIQAPIYTTGNCSTECFGYYLYEEQAKYPERLSVMAATLLDLHRMACARTAVRMADRETRFRFYQQLSSSSLLPSFLRVQVATSIQPIAPNCHGGMASDKPVQERVSCLRYSSAVLPNRASPTNEALSPCGQLKT